MSKYVILIVLVVVFYVFERNVFPAVVKKPYKETTTLSQTNMRRVMAHIF